MTKETAFQTLGISEDASPQQIKQAWRDMLAVWHPDKHMGNERLRRKAEEQTKRINEAYDRIQTGNFKSSNRPQSESPPYEDFRRASEYYYARREEEARARADAYQRAQSATTPSRRFNIFQHFGYVLFSMFLFFGTIFAFPVFFILILGKVIGLWKYDLWANIYGMDDPKWFNAGLIVFPGIWWFWMIASGNLWGESAEDQQPETIYSTVYLTNTVTRTNVVQLEKYRTNIVWKTNWKTNTINQPSELTVKEAFLHAKVSEEIKTMLSKDFKSGVTYRNSLDDASNLIAVKMDNLMLSTHSYKCDAQAYWYSANDVVACPSCGWSKDFGDWDRAESLLHELRNVVDKHKYMNKE